MNSTKIQRLLGIVILLISCSTLDAQQDNPQGPPMRGPAMERVEQWKKVRMMEVLKLDDETSIRFFNRYNKHQLDLREIQRKREGLVQQLESAIRSNASEKEFEKSLQEFQSLEGKMMEARDGFVKDVRGILTAKQLAEYIVFETNFNRSLRDLMRDSQFQPMDRMQRRPR